MKATEIPISVPDLSGNEGRYLTECIETNYVSSVGPFVERFEQRVARASHAVTATATCSGTAGLHAALAGVGVQRGDLVVVPSYTFVASANAVSLCGAEPWLFDVASDRWTLDPTRLRQELERETRSNGSCCTHRASGRRVAALLPVYTLGLPAQMDQLGDLASHFGFPIVADAAAALGARLGERGLAKLADLTVFSFNGNKTVTAGGGGAVVGCEASLVERVAHLCSTARRGEEYLHDQVAFNYRMSNLQAAVGCAQLERLEALLTRKREIRVRYNRAFFNLDSVQPFPDPAGSESACWLSGIVLDPRCQLRLEDLCEQLRHMGIESHSFWKPIHMQPAYREAPRASDLSVSESLAERILVLPSSVGLSDKDQDYVVDAVRAIIASASRKSSSVSMSTERARGMT